MVVRMGNIIFLSILISYNVKFCIILKFTKNIVFFNRLSELPELMNLKSFLLIIHLSTSRSVAELERQYISLQARLNKETASSGDPLAVAERYKATKLRYKQIKDDLDRHQCLLKVFFTIDVYYR